MMLLDVLINLIRKNLENLIHKKFDDISKIEIKIIIIDINEYFAFCTQVVRININNKKYNKTTSTLYKIYKSFLLLERGTEHYVMNIYISFINNTEDYVIENAIDKNIHNVISLINKFKKITNFNIMGTPLLTERNIPADLFLTKLKFSLIRKFHEKI
jgi:hypothetical protein